MEYNNGVGTHCAACWSRSQKSFSLCVLDAVLHDLAKELRVDDAHAPARRIVGD